MNREQLVENVVKAAMRLALIQDESGVVHNEGSPIANLRVAARALRAFDAEKPKAIKWGCRVVCHKNAPRLPYGIDSSDGKHGLRPLGGWYEINHRLRSDQAAMNFCTLDEALAALGACQTPPPGYVEPTPFTQHVIGPIADGVPRTSTTIPMPADEWVTETDAAKIPALLDRLRVGALVLGYCMGCGRVVDGPVMMSLTHGWHGVSRDKSASLCRMQFHWLKYRPSDLTPLAEKAGEVTPTLAARVAELERQVIHESRCRVELDGCVESMHIRFTESIEALRRDVDAMSEQAQTDRENSASMFLDYLKRIERLEKWHDALCAPSPAPVERTASDRARVKQMALDELERRKAEREADKQNQNLPFGCVAHRHPNGCWTIKNQSLTHWWGGNAWFVDANPGCGNFTHEYEALADFWATNKGEVPPPARGADKGGKYDVIGEGPYYIEHLGGTFDVTDGSILAFDHRTGRHRGTPFASLAIALAVAAALEKRA